MEGGTAAKTLIEPLYIGRKEATESVLMLYSSNAILIIIIIIRVAQNSAWNFGLLAEAKFCNFENTEFLQY